MGQRSGGRQRHPAQRRGPTTAPDRPPRWPERRWAARTIRLFVFVVPIVLSFLVAWTLSRSMAVPDGWWERVGRWLFIALIATLVMIVAQRVLRRLLPLAALLSLTLVFPDETPSRFGVALRGMSARRLDHRLAHLDDEGLGETPREAASTLLELVAALSRHDRLTRGHSERVRAYAVMLGEEMELPEEEIDQLRWAALLHDVGKLAVPQEVLTKPDPLTNEEFEIIRSHPGAGQRLVAPLAGWLGPSAEAVHQHHERWEGGGYPTGLPSDGMAMTSRIVSVADAFDVMTSARSYKEPTSASAARAELQRCAGTQFDPTVVRAMMNISLGRLWRAMGPLSWLAQLSLFPRGVVQAGPAVSSVAAALVSLVLAGLADVASTTREGVDSIAVASAALDSGARTDLEPPPTTERSAAGASPTGSTRSASDGDDDPAIETAIETEPTVVGQFPTIVTTPPRSAATTTTSTTILVVTTPPTTPPTTSATIVTVPPPPTAPVVTVPPPTTTIPPFTDSFSLSAGGLGDQVWQPLIDLEADQPPAHATLPNYDTDHNEDPGLTVVASPNGLLTRVPEGVQTWRLPETVVRIAGPVSLSLWVAPDGPQLPGLLEIRAGLFDCDLARTDCVSLIGETVKYTVSSTAFAPVDFDLTVPGGHTVAAERRFELRVATLNGSSNDLWLGYDSLETPSTLAIAS